MSRSGHAPERDRRSPLPDEPRSGRPPSDEGADTPRSGSLWASTLQVRRFAAVGVLNTAVDYGIFITLTKLLRLPLGWVWIAKLVSGSVAIALSFYLNRRWVFRSVGGGHTQAVRFLATTLVGVIGIQTSFTQLFASRYTSPGRSLFDVLKDLGLHGDLPSVVTEPLAIKTAAFVIATAASMTFNFVLYRYWVFSSSGSSRVAIDGKVLPKD